MTLERCRRHAPFLQRMGGGDVRHFMSKCEMEKVESSSFICLIFTAANPMRTINPKSIERKCIVCGIGKPLNSDCFQVVRTFAKGYSFYCNACDTESKKLKKHARPKQTPGLVNDAISLDHIKESPA